MNLRLSLLVSAISVLFSSAVRGDTYTNLVENFSNYNSVWGATGDASKLVADVPTETALADTDTPGWTGTGLVFRAKSSLRLGNSTTKGMVFTPPISLHPNAKTPGSATLSFHAGRTTGNNSTTISPVVTIVDANGNTVDDVSPSSYSPTPLIEVSSLDNLDTCYTNKNGDAISQTFNGLPDSFRFKFITSAAKEGRVEIDAVLVTQEIFEPAIISVK